MLGEHAVVPAVVSGYNSDTDGMIDIEMSEKPPKTMR